MASMIRNSDRLLVDRCPPAVLSTPVNFPLYRSPPQFTVPLLHYHCACQRGRSSTWHLFAVLPLSHHDRILVHSLETTPCTSLHGVILFPKTSYEAPVLIATSCALPKDELYFEVLCGREKSRSDRVPVLRIPIGRARPQGHTQAYSLVDLIFSNHSVLLHSIEQPSPHILLPTINHTLPPSSLPENIYYKAIFDSTSLCPTSTLERHLKY